jgi:hypothetical protein
MMQVEAVVKMLQPGFNDASIVASLQVDSLLSGSCPPQRAPPVQSSAPALPRAPLFMPTKRPIGMVCMSGSKLKRGRFPQRSFLPALLQWNWKG